MDETLLLPLLCAVKALVAHNRALEERVSKLEDDAKRAAERRALAAQKAREELDSLGPVGGDDSLSMPPRPNGPPESP
jgi:hypothetical protein